MRESEQTFRTTTLTKIIERAYVFLSHEHPGLTFYSSPPDSTQPTFDIRFTTAAVNSGNTPADVIASDLRLVTMDQSKSLPLNPAKPALPTALDAVFTLMPRERNYFWRNVLVPNQLALHHVQYMAVRTYVIGWILYRDKFGQLHRSGYARQYWFNQDPNGNNLVFVEAPGYNYDEDLIG